MNFFDIMGLVSKVPYESVQKLEADIPKLQRLGAIYQQAEPHINALLPLVKEAEGLWDQISPDVMNIFKAIRSQS